MNKTELMDVYYRIKLARSFETRVAAARFLKDLKALLEDPGALLA
ncbi:MAG: hypothetical protein V2A58_07835 [Planctomycetota bacterium]